MFIGAIQTNQPQIDQVVTIPARKELASSPGNPVKVSK